MTNPQNRVAAASIEIDADISAASDKIESAVKQVESIGPAADGASAQAQQAVYQAETALDSLLAKLNQVKAQTADVTSFSEASWGKAKKSASSYLSEFKVVDFRKVTQEIKQELDEVGTTGDISGRRLTGAINKAGDAFTENTRKITAFQTKLTAALGVVTGITGAVALAAGGFIKFGQAMLAAAKEAGRVRDAVKDLRDTIDEFDPTSAVSGINDLTKQYGALLEQIQSANLPLEETMALWDRLDKNLKSAKATAREIRFDEAEKSARSAASALENISDQINASISATPELDSAWRDYSKTMEEINRQVDRLREGERELFGSGRLSEANELLGLRRQLYKEAVDAANEQLELRLQGIAEEEQLRAKEQDDRLRKEREAMEAVEAEKDRRSQERVQRETDAIRRALESITSGDFVTTLEAIPRALKEVSNGVRRLK